jgi:hypothetical protein
MRLNTHSKGLKKPQAIEKMWGEGLERAMSLWDSDDTREEASQNSARLGG